MLQRIRRKTSSAHRRLRRPRAARTAGRSNHSIEVETFEFLRIAERFAHGVRLGGVLVKNIQFQLIGPPGKVRLRSPAHSRVDGGA